jgi:hypothetical protein
MAVVKKSTVANTAGNTSYAELIEKTRASIKETQAFLLAVIETGDSDVAPAIPVKGEEPEWYRNMARKNGGTIDRAQLQKRINGLKADLESLCEMAAEQEPATAPADNSTKPGLISRAWSWVTGAIKSVAVAAVRLVGTVLWWVPGFAVRPVASAMYNNQKTSDTVVDWLTAAMVIATCAYTGWMYFNSEISPYWAPLVVGATYGACNLVMQSMYVLNKGMLWLGEENNEALAEAAKEPQLQQAA